MSENNGVKTADFEHKRKVLVNYIRYTTFIIYYTECLKTMILKLQPLYSPVSQKDRPYSTPSLLSVSANHYTVANISMIL